MEFFTLGKHCTICKVIDYLPFTCEHCQETYCVDHRTVKDHECKKYVEVKKESKQIVEKLHSCKIKNCEEASLSNCKKCKNRYCLDHLKEKDHKCLNTKTIKEIFEENRIKRELEKKIQAEKELKKLSEEFGVKKILLKKPIIRKSDEKIKFSNTKETAIGNANISEDERFYFKVFFPFDSKLQPIHYFTKKSISIGKLLDDIAYFGEIDNTIFNRNDVKKLNLYNLKTLECIEYKKCFSELEKEKLLKQNSYLILERGVYGEKLSMEILLNMNKEIIEKNVIKFDYTQKIKVN
jgi:AN1-type zinc finger protein 1